MVNSNKSLFSRAISTLAICAGTSLVALAQPAPTTPPPPTQPAAPTAPPAMTPPSTAPVVPIDQNSPRGAMKTLVTAITNGDADSIRKVVEVSTPIEQKVVDTLIKRSQVDAGLRNAAIKAFGEGAKSLVGDTEKMTAEGMAALDRAQEKIDGDNAAVDAGAGSRGEPVKLHKVNGSWHIRASEFTKGGDEKQIMQQMDDLNAQADVLKAVTADINAGKFKTADETMEEIKRQMMVAMMKRSAPPATEPAGAPPTSPDSGAK